VGPEGWGDLLAHWPGRALPNVYFQEPDPWRRPNDTWDRREFLDGPVRAWEALTQRSI
jgi:hypothetical protein